MSAAWVLNQSVLGHRAHHVPHRHGLFEFRLAGRSTVTPMHRLLLGFWGRGDGGKLAQILRFIYLCLLSYSFMKYQF